MSTLLPSIHPASQAKNIQSFIKKSLKQSNHSKLVLALSGGLDSSTVLTLATQALKPQDIFVLKLPYNKSFPQALIHTNQVIKFNKILKRNVFEVNIGPSVERIWKSILIKCSTSQTGQSKLANQIRFGNIMARTRMIYTFDMARARKTLVLGAANKSEIILGYYTRFGDEAADILPLAHLYKTQVYALATHLQLPESILNASPTAGLWNEQTDKEELGFNYETADQILYLRFEQKNTPIQIAKKLHQNSRKKSETYWRRLVQKVLRKVETNQFKTLLPYSL